MHVRAIITMLVVFLVRYSTAQDYRHFFNEAKKALDEKRYEEFNAAITKAHELHPYHQTILWYMGMAASLNGKSDEAIDFLTRALNINTQYNLEDENLDGIRKDPRFQGLIKTKQGLDRPFIGSDTAYIIQDRQLHLESVAYDPLDKILYGGSIYKRKIIKVNGDGVASDFALPERSGMGSVFGLKVDSKKRILWACTSAIPEMQHYDSTLLSQLFQFDLTTGKLVRGYLPADTLGNHIFGDLALDSKGVPYVSDSKNNVIYKLDPKHHELRPFFHSKEFWSIQGLSFSEYDRFLYVADYIKGIFRLDLQNMVLSKVNVSYGLSLKGTDGILFYKNSLITIQNGVQPNRVVRHFFNEARDGFIRYEYIDNAHPAFGEPTIGCLSGSTFLYVANSQWIGYEDGRIKDAELLHPIVILKCALKDK